MLRLEYAPYVLQFCFEARNSKGLIPYHKTWLLRVSAHGVAGIGECAPLVGLSKEGEKEVQQELPLLAKTLTAFSSAQDALEESCTWLKNYCPSLCFGVETALLDLQQGGVFCLSSRNSFYTQQTSLTTSGLVWMNQTSHMWTQVQSLWTQGFRTIKLKIGAQNFEEECALLDRIRKRWPASVLHLRLDANGAFSAHQIHERLKRLSAFDIACLEQPLSPEMSVDYHRLFTQYDIPLALDESLIDVPLDQAESLLDTIQPQILVLKPTLLGGGYATKQWIRYARQRGIKWWISSALESNIGLNALAQHSAQIPQHRVEGLGTGGLYRNNFHSPLQLQNDQLIYAPNKTWDISPLKFLSLR